MVDQVNRLAGDLLAGGGELLLPDVGTLYTERRSARRISNRTVLPPVREVLFSEQQDGVSLTDEIARTTGCDAAEAKEIYDRWLAHVQTGDTLTIDGVGRLNAGKLTVEPAFDARLNPQGREPIRVKKSGSRLDWALWVGIVAVFVVLALGALAYWHIDRTAVEQTAAVETPPQTTPATADTVATAASAPADSDSVQTALPAPTPSAAAQPQLSTKEQTIAANVRAQKPSQAADEVLAFVSGRHYVVLGVFSTQANARRASAAAAKKEDDLHCSVYRYGSKFMVSAFETSDAETAAQFIRAHRDRYPDLWSYTAH